ncbi:hypothetical protein GPECTOR_38g307 [Gonium pectorale]|uniref:CNNM transmembrane domain-containing protein n=1 Tax=Gonium pectorale TaxID=33097 RepID=A0A150GCL4_GONPE|nr:hypothetical protein GPECTOR_38g307 [Gonium pectorale]|eukprot:KXZ47070.1 hypothetical protein GPECTOR_38g307 [Gonium pectorale]
MQLILIEIIFNGLDLEVVRRSGSATQRKWAVRVIPLLENPHWLLVALVLINAACNTSLPIFLDRLVSPAVAIILATTAVLIFGEILPQLKALVALHAKHEGLGGNLSEDETKIIRGVLDLAGKDGAAAMTPLDCVFSLPADAVLNRRCLAAVLRTGLSRVPVWRRGPLGYPEFLGFLLTKEVLQKVDPSKGVRAGDAPMRVLPHLSARTSLFDLLKFFCGGRCHMVNMMMSGSAGYLITL